MTQQQANEQAREELGAFLQTIAAASELSEEEIIKLYQKAKQGASIAEMFNIPQESLLAGYAMAVKLYTLEQYSDAETMFRALCQYEENNPKNWVGLGCCLQQKGNFAEAAFCYARAADLGYPLYAKPLYLLAQCLCTINEYPTAKKILKLALGAQADNEEQTRYIEQAKVLLDSLPKE